MKLTPFAKLFITVVILGVIGYAVWHYQGDAVRRWALGERARVTGGAENQVGAGDFDALKNAPPDPERGIGATGVTAGTLSGASKLSRPLVVAMTPGPATPRGSCSTREWTPAPRRATSASTVWT